MDLDPLSCNCSKNDTEIKKFIQTLTPNVPVIVYTDGACSGNPGPGSWCVYMIK